MSEEQCYCACLKVKYDPQHNKDGGISERWRCELCGSDFVRGDFLRDARAQIERLEGERASSLDRDFLGQLVRVAWIEWAKEQPNPRASWLVPWNKMMESDREADRRIGEYVAARCVTPELLRVESRAEQLEGEVERLRDWLRCLSGPLSNARATARPSADAPCNLNIQWRTGADTVVEILNYLDALADEDPTAPSEAEES